MDQSIFLNQISSILLLEIRLQIDTFAELNISIIYRVIEKSSSKGINNDRLYEFIKKSINKFSSLFSFLNLQLLSKDRFQDLYELYSNDQNKKYFDFLKCDLILIN